MIEGQIGQQIPVLRHGGPVGRQPLPFCPSHGFPAKRALGRETRRLQLPDSFSKGIGEVKSGDFKGGEQTEKCCSMETMRLVVPAVKQITPIQRSASD